MLLVTRRREGAKVCHKLEGWGKGKRDVFGGRVA